MNTSVTPSIEVIDQNDSPRRSLEFMLRCAGFQVRAHCEAEHFLRSDADLSHSIILMDVPGLEFCYIGCDPNIAVIAKSSPTIFMSAVPEPMLISQSLELGGIDFLFKPFRKTELLVSIARAMACSRPNAADGAHQPYELH